MLDHPAPFGTSRIHLTVDAGSQACLEYDRQGESRWSWRPGQLGQGGDWSEDLPEVISGVSVFTATTMEDGASIAITVTDVVDNASDCDKEAEEPAPEPGACLLQCLPSDYYRFPDQLAEWLREALDLLE